MPFNFVLNQTLTVLCLQIALKPQVLSLNSQCLLHCCHKILDANGKFPPRKALSSLGMAMVSFLIHCCYIFILNQMLTVNSHLQTTSKSQVLSSLAMVSFLIHCCYIFILNQMLTVNSHLQTTSKSQVLSSLAMVSFLICLPSLLLHFYSKSDANSKLPPPDRLRKSSTKQSGHG